MLVVARALAHNHLVEGHEFHHRVGMMEQGIDGEGETLGRRHFILCGRCIADAAEYVYFGHRGGIGEATGLQDEILHGGAFGKLVGAGIHHLSADFQCLLSAHLHTTGNKEHIVLAQGHIGHLACHDAFQVNRYHLKGQVVAQAVHYSTTHKGILTQAIGHSHQFAHGAYAFAQLELAGVHHRTTDLHHVAEPGRNAVDIYRVAVGHHEGAHLELVYRVDAVFGALFAGDSYIINIRVAREPARVRDRLLQALGGLHLVEHGPTRPSADVHQAFIRTHHNHVVVREAHIALGVAVEQIIVHVNGGYHLARTEHLDATYGTQIVDTSGGIEGVEGRAETAEGVGAGHIHLAHHLHSDGACLAHRKAEAAIGIVLAQPLLDGLGGLLHAHARQTNGTHVFHHNHAIG